jgi:carbon monoxide dehydrogenase subunit G
MAFEIVKTFVVRCPPEQVWRFLTDPEKVARCLPGAAITGKLDEKTWHGTMTVKVGPVSSSYKGKVAFEKLDAASRTAEIVATGQDTRGRGGADLRLTSTMQEKSPGETEVTTTSRVNITGILAQMGRGMVQDVGDQMFQIFSQRVRAELESAHPAESVAAAAPTAARAPAASQSEPLNVGALGVRAAVRAPLFWIGIALIAGLLYVLFR